MDRIERSTEPVPEVAVRLRVNGAPVAVWTCSPGELRALGAGRLVSLGYARESGDIVELTVAAPDHGVHIIEARVPSSRVAEAEEERRHRREHGCGLRFLVDCRPDLLPAPAPARARSRAPSRAHSRAPDLGPASGRDSRDARDARTAVPEMEAFPELFRELFDRSPSRSTTGGHHTTALTDGRRLLHVHEEVGRHNGADKALGSALLAGDALPRLGLLTTARISGEIAEKAARAGVAWVASRSVPTTMAVEIASAAGLALVARAPGKDARVFR